MWTIRVAASLDINIFLSVVIFRWLLQAAGKRLRFGERTLLNFQGPWIDLFNHLILIVLLLNRIFFYYVIVEIVPDYLVAVALHFNLLVMICLRFIARLGIRIAVLRRTISKLLSFIWFILIIFFLSTRFRRFMLNFIRIVNNFLVITRLFFEILS